MAKSIFGAYDIRGIYPDQINENLAEKLIPAFQAVIKPGTIVIAHDGRHGSDMIAAKLEDAFGKNSNYTVEHVGLSTTPLFYFLVNNMKASGGVMVTASHNPKEYNGFKVVGEHAVLIPGIEIKKHTDINL